MRNLVLRLGIEPGPPALGARSLNHWTTREVPVHMSLTPDLLQASQQEELLSGKGEKTRALCLPGGQGGGRTQSDGGQSGTPWPCWRGCGDLFAALAKLGNWLSWPGCPPHPLSAPLGPSGLSVRDASPRYLPKGAAFPGRGRPQSPHGPYLVISVLRHWKPGLLLTLQS